MQDAKEEVRARLNIEDVIGEYVQLKRAGRNFKGLSPFSQEKTPSFVVSPDKQIWHDFSSGRGGDVFSFVMEAEGMDFRASLEHLARKAGVDMTQFDRGDGKLAQKKRRALEAHALAARYYQQSLLRNQHALEYVFKKRGLNKQIVQSFQIGYAPESGTALVQFLAKKGFARRELDEAGLLNRFGGDLFRGRMMVPLMDPSGQVIGFTARIMKDDPKAPKYLNTPQTLLYDKSRHVFGLSQAKEAIRKNDYVVIVEGNMDVVSSHQAGVTGVVATAGTALTEQHLKALARLTHTIRLSFDGDKAGIAASERAIPIAETVGVELTMVSLPEPFKDPDELIQQGVEKWQAAIDAHQPVVDWILSKYENQLDLTTAAGKKAFTDASLGVIRLLTDPVVRDHYLSKITTLTGGMKYILEEHLRNGMDERQPAEQPQPTRTVKRADRAADTTYAYQDNLFAAALIDGETHELFAGVDPESFAGEERQAVARYLQEHGGQAVQDVPEQLQKFETYVKIVLLKAENRYATWSPQERALEVAKLLRHVATKHKETKRDELIARLRDAETIGDDDTATKLRFELNNLIKEKR